MSLAQTAYGFAIGKRVRFVLSIIKQKILIGCFAEEYFVGWLVGLEPTTFRTTI